MGKLTSHSEKDCYGADQPPRDQSFGHLNHHILWGDFLWPACLQLLLESTLLHTSQKMKSKRPPTHQPTHEKRKGKAATATAVESGDGNEKDWHFTGTLTWTQIHVSRHGVTTNSHVRSKLSRHSKVKEWRNVTVMEECSLKIGPFIVQDIEASGWI